VVCSALKHLPGQIFGAGGLGFLDCARVEKSIEIVDDVQNIPKHSFEFRQVWFWVKLGEPNNVQD
jgi:hypothetical protein